MISNDTLRLGAVHVAYEFRMLRDALLSATDRFAYTAWFIHRRTLMDFFDFDGSGDDLSARHYYEPSLNWKTIRANVEPPVMYDEYRKAVNKLAAHLTVARIEYAEKKTFTPSREITEYLLGLAALFLREMPADRLPWFGGLSLPLGGPGFGPL
jgi:hypothetical protein